MTAPLPKDRKALETMIMEINKQLVTLTARRNRIVNRLYKLRETEWRAALREADSREYGDENVE